jgi:serine protease
MARTLIPILLALLAVSAPAQETKSRYLVATRGDAFEIPFANRERATRNFVKFRSVDGYAADLTPSEVARLRRSPHVLSVEPDATRQIHGYTASPNAIPFRKQTTPYGITAVNAPSVWSATRGEGIRVAVLDTGIDAKHADLIANYKGGYDFIHNDPDPDDEGNESYMHGTLMAGIIAAADNGLGIVGVAPRAEIYALKIFGSDDNAHSSAIIAAIDWAIANKMHVLSCSFGGDGKVGLEEAAYRRAADAGIVVIASTGNDSRMGLRYPGAYESVISVGAVDRQRALASFSNWGPQIDFVAPGVDVLSTAITGKAMGGGVLFDDGSAIFGSWVAGDAGAEAIGPVFNASQGRAGDFNAASANAINVLARGSVRNDDRIANARGAGAAAVVFVNHQTGPCHMQVNLDPANPPAICVTQSDGALLQQRAGQTATFGVYLDDYVSTNGTSMSVPHVAGAAALLLALKPGVDVEKALRDTAADLGTGGWDDRFGYGLIDVGAAARMVAPEKFVTNARGPRRRSVAH